MPNFAIINGTTVSNVIVADTKEIALEVTNADDAIETDGQPWIGWTLVDGEWIKPTEQENEWLVKIFTSTCLSNQQQIVDTLCYL